MSVKLLLFKLISINCWLEKYSLRDFKQTNNGIEYRLFSKKDSIEELTEVINKAYSIYDQMGLNFMGVKQNSKATLKRINNAICLIAVHDKKIVGTITYKPPYKCKGSKWFNLSYVAKFNQLSVLPELQDRGIGGELIRITEQIAIKTHAKELALDTSEKATELIAYYMKKGYRFIENIKWKERNYNSVVLSKRLF